MTSGLHLSGSNPANTVNLVGVGTPSEHLPLKVPTVQFDFDISVRHYLLSTHTSKSNLTLGTHLHALIRTHHIDFDVRFWPKSALMLKT